MSIIMNGKQVAENMINNLSLRVNNLKQKGVAPSLVVFTSDHQSNQSYLKNIIKVADKIGIEIIEVKANSYNDLVNQAFYYGKRPFIIQKPNSIHEDTIDVFLDEHWWKDVDGFSTYNLGAIIKGEKSAIYPCTPNAVVELLSAYNIPIRGANVVVIGRSDVVGKPLSLMLTAMDANVTLCHSKTTYTRLIDYCNNANIIISAVGNHGVLRDWMAKPSQVLVDVGINHVDGKLCGDFTETNVKNCYAYSPVPGGVGPLTCVELMKNVVEYWEYQA